VFPGMAIISGEVDRVAHPITHTGLCSAGHGQWLSVPGSRHPLCSHTSLAYTCASGHMALDVPVSLVTKFKDPSSLTLPPGQGSSEVIVMHKPDLLRCPFYM
jgi:hypothetical protein